MEGVNTPLPEEVPPKLHDNDMLPPLSRPRKDPPVGGRLAHFQNRWGEITEDSWVLSVVRKGYKIPFVNKPFLSPTPIFLQQTESLALVEEVNKLLHKGAVEKIEPEGPGFYSCYFPGSQEEREITTNNRSVQTEYVSGYSVVQNGDSLQGQTGDSTQLLGILTRSDRCLSTCSYSPAVSEVSPFLSQGSGLSIQGSSICPYVFTRLMVAIATYLRKRAIVLFPYMDDWLVRNQVRQEILRDRQFTIELIMSLGLIINEEKSDLVPSQNFVFIGMEFLTHKNIVQVPLDRVQGILELLLRFKKQKQSLLFFNIHYVLKKGQTAAARKKKWTS